jgi:radical SAM protein with 4Fe4S-binding SPASM domain
MKDPFHIQWHITNLCNLHCKHCYQEDFSNRYDLDWGGLKKISNNILGTLNQWNQTVTIHLTGGEPLLKQELFPLLKDLDQSPVVEELGIITNGLLLDRKLVNELSGICKLRKIKVSLDGADAETHDSIRQKGSFEKAIRKISLIKNEHRFETVIMFTLMKRNYKDLQSFVRLCQELGVDGLILERFIPLGRGREVMDEVLQKAQWKELVETIEDLFEIGFEESPLFPYQAFQIHFNGDEPELFGAPCIIGREGLCIMPEGTVLPCRRFPVPIGNLLSDSLKDIWERSEILEKLSKKENLTGKCGSCGIENCRGCRSLALALTGDSLAEDPHCPLNLRTLSSST